MTASANILHEKLRFGGDRALSGLLSYPERDAATTAVLLCSPHPNFGGDMHNNVVAAIGDRLSLSVITLRFDYRGVGDSRIDLPEGADVSDYWDTIEETLDYTAPIADTTAALETLSEIAAGLPIVAVGYSFGAIMATRIGIVDERVIGVAGVAPPLRRVGFEHLHRCPKPGLLISGQDDFVFDPGVADRLASQAGPRLTIERPVGDHFFIGRESDVAERLARFVRDLE